MTRLTIILAVALLAEIAAATPRVRLRPAAVVDGEEVTVGDVVDATDVDADVLAAAVGVAPDGGALEVTLQQVERAMHGAGANLARVRLSGAASCRVRRIEQQQPTQPAEPARRGQGSSAEPTAEAEVDHEGADTLAARVRALTADQLGVRPEDLVIEFHGRSEESAELALDGEVSVTSTDSRLLGRRGWRVDQTIDGRHYRRYLRATVAVRRLAVVAAEDTPAETTLTAEHVRTVRRVDDGRDESIGDESLAIGQQTRRAIRAGEPIRPDDLVQPVLVRRGQEIGVAFVRGSLRVTARARALADGREGESIPFERTGVDGRRRFWAVVTGPGAATVTEGAEQ